MPSIRLIVIKMNITYTDFIVMHVYRCNDNSLCIAMSQCKSNVRIGLSTIDLVCNARNVFNKPDSIRTSSPKPSIEDRLDESLT